MSQRNRHYVVMITDATGRRTRRFRVARSWLELAAAVGVVFVLAAGGLTLHATLNQRRAAEARELARENAELSAISKSVEQDLLRLREVSTRTELVFVQLWSKSGLGLDPQLLGVGPVEPTSTGPSGTGAAEGEQPVLAIDPIAIPLELVRLGTDAGRVQQKLGELFEYFHDATRLLQNTPSVRPAHTPWLTSSFGTRRDPMNGTLMMHKGLDIGGEIGTPIFAPADGVVIFAGYRGGYGQTVVIDHGYGMQTHFAHLSRFRSNMGQRVRRGELIANMGNTGKSTGPHLHYEVRRWGRPLNPMHFILD